MVSSLCGLDGDISPSRPSKIYHITMQGAMVKGTMGVGPKNHVASEHRMAADAWGGSESIATFKIAMVAPVTFILWQLIFVLLCRD